MPTIRSPKGLRQIWIASVAALSLLAPGLALAQTANPTPSIGTYAEQGSGPGLWVVRDEDSTLYLFGTFHALKPDTAWRTTVIDQAFASAEEYWFEVADINDVSSVVPIIQQKGISPNRPLSSLLTPEETAILNKAAETVGLTGAQLDPMRPWFASMNLAVAAITAAGYKAENGGDQILHAMAQSAGKPIKGFETLDQQIGFLADMDEEGQLQLLRSSLSDFTGGAEQLDQLVEAWSKGDVKALDDLAGVPARAEAPTMYDILFTQRNKNWANQVEQILAGKGTVFIAVGAGHLVGPDSLQVKLSQRGIQSERVAP